MRESLGVDVLGEVETRSAVLGQTDQFLKPRGPGGLQMHTRVESLECLVNRRINGKLVAAGVDAQLQARRQPIFSNRLRDRFNIVGELLGKLRDIADIIDPLVEAACELGSNRLNGNPLEIGRASCRERV